MSTEWKKEVGICDFEYLYLPLLNFHGRNTKEYHLLINIFKGEQVIIHNSD